MTGSIRITATGRRSLRPSPRPPGKRLVEGAMALCCRPRVLVYRILARLIGADRALAWVTEKSSRSAGPLGVLYRSALYKRILAHMGRDVSIGFGTCFSRPEAQLGNRVYLGRRCSVGWAIIGDDVHVADGAQLLSGRHQHDEMHVVTVERITIGRGAWIGANAIIMADVGANARVGAGAVVTHPVPLDATVAGVPARPVRHGVPLAMPQPQGPRKRETKTHARAAQLP